MENLRNYFRFADPAERISLADLVLVYLARLQNVAGEVDQTSYPNFMA